MPKIDNRLVTYQKMTNLIYYSKNLLKKYPKSERFDLCNDIKNVLYENLKYIVYAWKAYGNLVVLKSFITISYKSMYINQKNYMVWNEQVDEIGKLIGGWMKSCQKE